MAGPVKDEDVQQILDALEDTAAHLEAVALSLRHKLAVLKHKQTISVPEKKSR